MLLSWDSSWRLEQAKDEPSLDIGPAGNSKQRALTHVAVLWNGPNCPSHPTIESLSVEDVENRIKNLTADELTLVISRIQQVVRIVHDQHPEKPMMLTALGDNLLRRFKHQANLSDVDQAVVSYKQALSLTPKEDPTICTLLQRLGGAHMNHRFRVTKGIPDIDEAIFYDQQLISLEPFDEEHKLEYLKEHSLLFLVRFQLSNRAEDIDQGIAILNQALSLAPAGSAHITSLLDNLGQYHQYRFLHFDELADLDRAIDLEHQRLSGNKTLSEHDPNGPGQLAKLLDLRFQRRQNLPDIDRAIICYEEAISAIPDEHSKKPEYLNCLGVALESRFKHLGNYKDLDYAITCGRKCLSLAPSTCTDRIRYLGCFLDVLRGRFFELAHFEDLNELIGRYRDAILLTEQDHENRIKFLYDLSLALRHRFENHGDIADIDQSIASLDRAILLATGEGATGVNIQILLLPLGISLSCRFKRLGQVGDIDWAIYCHRKAVFLTAHDDENMVIQLAELGGALAARFQRTGCAPDIDEAIGLLDYVISVNSGNPFRQCAYLQMHAVSSLNRFESTGQILDLNRSITSYEQAVPLLPDGHSDKPVILNGLGNALGERFERLGNLVDIDQAITSHIQSILLTPDNHPQRNLRCANAGSAFIGRFLRLGQYEDMNKAIEYQEQALINTLDNHADKYGFYIALGNSLRLRYLHSKGTTDIDWAVSCFNDALKIIPEGHVGLASAFAGLGMSLWLRFDVLGREEDIDRATDSSIQALALTSDDHSSKHARYGTVADVYFSRFRHSASIKDLEMAIEYGTLALALVPMDDVGRCTRLISLGRYLLRQAELNEDQRNISQVVDYFRQAAELEIGPPAIRFQAACHWASLTSSQSLDGYRAAISLLPRIIWLGATVQQRYQSILSIGDIAVEAAAAAIRFRELDLALEWLEESRSIVWQQLMNLRTPFDDLRVVDPALADRLETVARQLDQVEAPEFLDLDINNPQSSERCSTVGHAPLPNFSLDKAKLARARLIGVLQSQNLVTRGVKKHRNTPCDIFRSILAALWSEVVKPVLDHLGYTTPLRADEQPHLTWCTTGPLSLLPLHAAGLHTDPYARVYNYVVSSYTPTLNALLATRHKPSSFLGVLAVGQAAAAGQAHLPGTIAELAQVKRHANGLSVTQLDGYDATASAVLAQMQTHSWIHLACHAIQNPVEPTKSAFLLHDSTLDLATIMSKSTTSCKGGLAYLSACQTATGDKDMPEEAVHLAAGMLMAGYSSVIATMWSIGDADAPVVADKVYAKLMEGGVADIKRAARALHMAVAELRDKVGEKEYERWVPYIHIGI